MADFYVQNLVQDFEKKRPLYEEFCLAAEKFLVGVLKERKYQFQIYYRIKSLERLEEKITRKKKQKKLFRTISEIEDLAGIRIVFYLESDKEKFIKDLESKMLICCIEDLEKQNGYRAKHVIVTFDKKRLNLQKYKKFKNLKCEVQLVSIFSHAWSELEHDWLYKDVYGIKSKNPEKYKIAKKQMESIFKNYVRKLTMKFEKVAKQLREDKKPH